MNRGSAYARKQPGISRTPLPHRFLFPTSFSHGKRRSSVPSYVKSPPLFVEDMNPTVTDEPEWRRTLELLPAFVCEESSTSHWCGSVSLKHGRDFRPKQPVESMLHPGVALRPIVDQHDERVHSALSPSRKKTGEGKRVVESWLVPVLRLHLALGVARTCFLKACNKDDVSLLKIDDHLVKRHALHHLLPAVREEAV